MKDHFLDRYPTSPSRKLSGLVKSKTILTKYRNEIIPDQISQARFRALLDERFSTCRDCFCHWTCAGDCFTRAFAEEPNGHLYKSMRCTINRVITKYWLLDFIPENEEVWRGDPFRQWDCMIWIKKDTINFSDDYTFILPASRTQRIDFSL